jgi:uncharacterized membrane protein YoaK (UPF0700 family)
MPCRAAMATVTAKRERPAPWPRRRHTLLTSRVRILLLSLSFAGGSVDASTYLGLGHAFPANMTGNTVLIALAIVRGAGSDAVRSCLALAGFGIGVALGTLLIQARGRWPGNAGLTLLFEVLVLAGLLLWWALIGPRPRYALIGVAAMAMGAQSTAVRVSRVGGVSTTYVTGTLTSAVAGLVMRARGRPPGDPGAPALPGEAWFVYGMGALAGALAEGSWHAAVVVIPLAIVLVTGAVASRESRG